MRPAMQEMPGQSCSCGDDRTEQAAYCDDCGTRKQWLSQGHHSDMYACPDCN
jgi:hypothetical protein